MILSTLLLTLAAVYAAFIGSFAVGLRRVLSGSGWGESEPESSLLPGGLPSVSVLVAARNEARTVGRCIDSILQGTYPPSLLEVIVVDDASTDGTAEAVRRRKERIAGFVHAGEPDETVQSDSPALHLVRLGHNPEGTGHGKRAALEAALARASGEIILMTDADCQVRPGWVGAMMNALADDVGFVAGPVLYRYGRGFAERAQALEFMGLVAMGAGGIGLGRPVICNGANAGFRAAAFKSVDGFGPELSDAPGQEELLMHRISSAGWQVAFCADAQAAVTTEPVHSLRAFLRQRIRWAAQAPRLPGGPFLLLLGAVFSFLLLLPAATLTAVFIPGLRSAVGTAWLLKSAIELTVLFPACRHFGRTGLLRVFLPVQLVHPWYIAFCAAAGALGRYTWKGRTVRE